MTRAVTLITGASEGIGVELAKVFARNGHDLALVARRRERLDALADEIAATGRLRPLVIALDLSTTDAAISLAATLGDAGATTAFLVNNAGFGTVGRFADADGAEQLGMIDLNVRALTDLTHRFLPQIVAAKGGVLNVASIAAYAPGPGMAVYYASKAFVLSFTEALAEELSGTGVRVCALCPGPVVTGFQARAGMSDSVMKDAGAAAVPARTVAEEGFAALMAGRRTIIPGAAAKMLAQAMAWIPHAILLPQLLARQAKRAGK